MTKSHSPLRKERDVEDIETIKRAIISNCGGWNGATDGEYAAKWASLSPEVRAEYLKEPAEKKHPNEKQLAGK